MLRPATPDAIALFHEGILALSQMEKNGIPVDVDYLEKTIKKVTWMVKQLEAKMKNHTIAKTWRKRFGPKTNYTSNFQLEQIIFDELEMERQEGRTTDTGKNKADKYAFEKVKLDYVDWYFYHAQLNKALNTNLKGIQKETIDGLVHVFFDLHKVGTFRSSSSRFNMQNQPVRMPFIGRLIRRCFIAPPGYRIGELDYGGIEVCGSACYHKDPVMIKYIEDPETDMHRDMSMQIFKLKKDQVTKDVRYNAKNKFVFPQFYGSYYIDCTKNLWDSIDSMELKTVSGKGLKKHLKKKGITERGLCDPKEEPHKKSLEAHIQDVEKDFWNNRFKVYAQWKRDWWKRYLKKGYFEFLTGFACQGLYNRKQVCNYPIQGSSFHCLLWALVQLQKWMNEKRLKSKLIFEIHDSIGILFHVKEVDYVLEKAVQIMTVDIRKHWPWIIVPLTVEAEIAPEGGSWYDKQKVKL